MRYILSIFLAAALAVAAAFALGWHAAETAASIVVGLGFIVALLYLINSSDKKDFR